MKYDILLSEKEIELCHKELNLEEINCNKETAIIYDSTRWPNENAPLLAKKRIPFKNYYFRLFFSFIDNIAPNHFERKKVGHYAKVVSERTTGLYSTYRFFHIYKHIMRIRPNSVVEYGSGASTVFISELLRYIHRENGIKGKVISFEQNEYYYDMLQNFFPDELREYAEIVLAPLQLQLYGSYRGLSYKMNKYPKSVDFVYIDGPTRIKPISNNPNFFFMSDIINLINNGCDLKFALTDHRYINYLPYIKLIGNKYHINIIKRYRSIEIQKK